MEKKRVRNFGERVNVSPADPEQLHRWRVTHPFAYHHAILRTVDASGQLPKYHIPARFVTLIPREFPAAQAGNKKRKSVTAAQAPAAAIDTPSSVKSIKSINSFGLQDDALGGMVNDMGLDDLQMSTDSLEDFGFDFDGL